MVSTRDTVPVTEAPAASVTMIGMLRVVVAEFARYPLSRPLDVTFSPDGMLWEVNVYPPFPPDAMSCTLTTLLEALAVVVCRVRGPLAVTVSANDTVPVVETPAESVTVTENVKVVVAVSVRVPVKRPELESVSPDGRLVDLNVYPPSPPVAVNCAFTELFETLKLVVPSASAGGVYCCGAGGVYCCGAGGVYCCGDGGVYFGVGGVYCCGGL